MKPSPRVVNCRNWLEHLRGSALDFRNLTNYIARSLHRAAPGSSLRASRRQASGRDYTLDSEEPLCAVQRCVWSTANRGVEGQAASLNWASSPIRVRVDGGVHTLIPTAVVSTPIPVGGRLDTEVGHVHLGRCSSIS